MMKKIIKNLRWYFWHPHQGLYNKNIRGKVRSIFQKPQSEMILKFVFFIDTLILWVRVFINRLSWLGLPTTIQLTILENRQIPICQDIPILYFDLGTHKKANELYWMVHDVLPKIATQYQAYGFEASPQTFEEAKKRFTEADPVMLMNKALCFSLPPDGKLRFYTDSSNNGVGSSLYRTQFQEYEEVEAIKFSDWLKEQNFDLDKSVCLIRMNIEGAEFDVISDLLESQLDNYIDGYFGAWDDVEKIDPKKDKQFRELLTENHITKIPFHEGDIVSTLRANAIKYQITTCVQKGLQRISSNDQA